MLHEIADLAIFLIVPQSQTRYVESGSEHQTGPSLLPAVNRVGIMETSVFKEGPSGPRSVLKMEPQLAFVRCGRDEWKEKREEKMVENTDDLTIWEDPFG